MEIICGINLWMLGLGERHEQLAEGGRGGIYCDKGTAGEKWTGMENYFYSGLFLIEG